MYSKSIGFQLTYSYSYERRRVGLFGEVCEDSIWPVSTFIMIESIGLDTDHNYGFPQPIVQMALDTGPRTVDLSVS